MVNSLFFSDITRQGKSTDVLQFGVSTKRGLVQTIILLSFTVDLLIVFKPSLFIGLLYRPCLLFFSPYTPLSPGRLPLHFMPTSITLHRSKPSSPSGVSATCRFKCITFSSLQPQHPKMCLRNEFRAAETSRRNYFLKRLFTCTCTLIRLHLFLL